MTPLLNLVSSEHDAGPQWVELMSTENPNSDEGTQASATAQGLSSEKYEIPETRAYPAGAGLPP